MDRRADDADKHEERARRDARSRPRAGWLYKWRPGAGEWRKRWCAVAKDAGSDGLKAKMRTVLNPDEGEPTWSGYTCFAAIAYCGESTPLPEASARAATPPRGSPERRRPRGAIPTRPQSPTTSRRSATRSSSAGESTSSPSTSAAGASSGMPSSTCRPSRSRSATPTSTSLAIGKVSFRACV